MAPTDFRTRSCRTSHVYNVTGTCLITTLYLLNDAASVISGRIGLENTHGTNIASGDCDILRSASFLILWPISKPIVEITPYKLEVA